MPIQLSEQYRKQGQSLFKLNRAGDAYEHVAMVPLRCRGLKQAVKWYEENPASPLNRAD